MTKIKTENTEQLVEEVGQMKKNAPKQVKTELSEYESFLKDPNNRKEAFKKASMIREAIGDHWFSLSRLKVKARGKIASLNGDPNYFDKLIQLCKMFGFIAEKTDTELQSGKPVEISKYMVVLSDDDKVVALQDVLNFYNNEAQKVQDAIDKLKEKSI